MLARERRRVPPVRALCRTAMRVELVNILLGRGPPGFHRVAYSEWSLERRGTRDNGLQLQICARRVGFSLAETFPRECFESNQMRIAHTDGR
jgi:hypothetical protein